MHGLGLPKILHVLFLRSQIVCVKRSLHRLQVVKYAAADVYATMQAHRATGLMTLTRALVLCALNQTIC